MPPGEITVTCLGCGNVSRLPFAAVSRNNSYCSRCGKRLPLENARAEPSATTANPARPKARRVYRPTKRR